MAVTTFKDFYNLTKNNIVYFQYQKDDKILNIKGTLILDLIPGSDDNLRRYDNSIKHSEFYLGTWIGSDSDRNEIITWVENSNSVYKIPEWLKIYSINYENWINIEIGKILSLQVIDS